MAAAVAFWTRETVASAPGTGDIPLGGAYNAAASTFAAAYADGESVSFVCVDGNNKQFCRGHYVSTGNKLVIDTVVAKLDSGTYSKLPGAGLTLSAATEVLVWSDLEEMLAGKLNAADLLAAILVVDGAGSGLDADTLDGLEAAAFALAGHTHADASETVKGLIELATQAEVDAGTDGVRAVTPATLAGALAGVGGGGVDSVNGQTGAVVTTGLYDLGSFVLGRPANGTNYGVNSTLAGSSLYATAAHHAWNDNDSAWRAISNLGNSLAGPSPSLVNTGSWRCVSPAVVTQSGIASPGIWVRYA